MRMSQVVSRPLETSTPARMRGQKILPLARREPAGVLHARRSEASTATLAATTCERNAKSGAVACEAVPPARSAGQPTLLASEASPETSVVSSQAEPR
jgi:hypothetical protein